MSFLKEKYQKGLGLVRFAGEKGLFHLMSANFLARFLGFSSQIVVAWILTPEDIGRIKIMQSYMSVFIVLAGFGFNVSILKLCSENRSPEEKSFLFRKGVIYSLIPQLVTFSIILFFIFNGWLSSDNIINRVFIVFALGIFPLTLDSSILSYLQSLKRIKEYSSIQVTTKIIGVLIVVILTYFFALWGYATAIVVGYFFTLIVIFIKSRGTLNLGVVPVANPFKLHFNYAFYSSLTNVLGMIALSVDIFTLNFLCEDRVELGYYSFATVFIGMLGIITRTVLQITHPHFSEKAENFANWKNSFVRYNKLMYIYLLVVFLLSLVAVPFFMKFTFGGKYSSSINYFVVLSIAWLIRDVSAFRGSALFGLGKIRANFIINLLSVMLSIVFVYLSFSFYGIKGVPFGMIIAGIFTYLISYLGFKLVIRKHQNDLL